MGNKRVKVAGLAGRIVKSPFLILLSIILGVLMGVFFKDASLRIAFIGGVYLDILRMTTFPILVTAIITSVGRMFGNPDAGKYVGRLIVVFLAAILLCGVIATGLGLVIRPGEGLSQGAQVTLGKALSEADQKGGEITARSHSVSSFLSQLIPENIFKSLGEGASLQILFFCLLLGIAVGLLKPDKREKVLGITEALYEACFIIIDWSLLLLPLGLFALLAGQIAQTGIMTMVAMVKYVIVVYASCLVFLLLSGTALCLSTKARVHTVLGALKESLLIAFGTQSSFASMPAAIHGLTRRPLSVDRDAVTLVMPIGIIITRFSMIITYAVATLFASQLYGVSLGASGMVLVVLLSVLTAVAGAGSPGIIAISMISVIFTPLGLPSGAMIVLLLAINPVIEPVTTLTNVFGNCAVTSVIAGRRARVARSAA